MEFLLFLGHHKLLTTLLVLSVMVFFGVRRGSIFNFEKEE